MAYGVLYIKYVYKLRSRQSPHGQRPADRQSRDVARARLPVLDNRFRLGRGEYICTTLRKFVRPFLHKRGSCLLNLN